MHLSSTMFTMSEESSEGKIGIFGKIGNALDRKRQSFTDSFKYDLVVAPPVYTPDMVAHGEEDRPLEEDEKQGWIEAKLATKLNQIMQAQTNESDRKYWRDIFDSYFLSDYEGKLDSLKERMKRVGITKNTVAESEEAEKYLGEKNVFGIDSILILEEMLSRVGKNVEFDLTSVKPLNYSSEDWKWAFRNHEILTYRPDSYVVKDPQRNRTSPIRFSVVSLYHLLKKNIYGESSNFFRFDEESTEAHFEKNSFHVDYLRKPDNTSGWGLTRRHPVPGSDILNGKKQRWWYDKSLEYRTWKPDTLIKYFKEYQLQAQSERVSPPRYRTASEAIWDTTINYAITRNRLLASNFDYTATAEYSYNRNIKIGVGGFNGKSIQFINNFDFLRTSCPNPGVYPTRVK